MIELFQLYLIPLCMIYRGYCPSAVHDPYVDSLNACIGGSSLVVACAFCNDVYLCMTVCCFGLPSDILSGLFPSSIYPVV